MNKNFVHESSYIDPGVVIGNGTQIWHFCHIMSGALIGDNCNIGQNVFVGRNVHIGNGVKIQNNVSVYEGVVVEDHVFIGPSVVFTNIKTPRSMISRKHLYKPTTIRKGATIGANTTIVCGVTIGEYALIGAGSVVTRDITDYALSYGNPSQFRGWVCKCGTALASVSSTIIKCEDCNSLYEVVDGTVFPIDSTKNTL